MRIRLAHKGDERKLAEVITAAWKDSYVGIVPDDFLGNMLPASHEKALKKALENGTEVIAALENEQKEIVGMASGAKDRSGKYDCELVAIYIRSEYRKLGYGKALVKRITEEHKKKGRRSMIIWTFEKNRDRKFYDGLEGKAVEKKYLTIGGKQIPAVGYVWPDIAEIRA